MAYKKLESDVATINEPPSEQTQNPTIEAPHAAVKTQTELDHDVALRIAQDISPATATTTKASIDESIQYINHMNSTQSIVFQTKANRSTNATCANCLCTIWERRDRATLILAPIVFSLLLVIMLAINHELIIVWCLNVFIFCLVLAVGYIYGYVEEGSILDLFSYAMLYGGIFGSFVWLFIWLLATTNNILVGPFMFVHSGINVNDTSNTILWSIFSCFTYGGLFPFCLIWLKSDKRIVEQCCPCAANCKLNGFYTLKEYETLQHVLNLTEQQMDQFMASNENEIKAKLVVAMKRLNLECVAIIVGYFGALYTLSFLLKFDGLSMVDSTLVFVLGYVGKDLVFGVLFALIASHIIGRRRLYQIRMNNKFVHYAVIMVLGGLQQCVGAILCGLYPQTIMRMNIVYISMAVNGLICIVAYIELYYQRKLLSVQLDALFVYNAINEADREDGSGSSSVPMNKLSAIIEQEPAVSQEIGIQ